MVYVKKVWMLPAILLLLSTAVAGCGSNSGGGTASAAGSSQELKVAMFGEPTNLNYMYEHDMMSTTVDWNLYDQLARWNYQTGKLDPELATSWKQTSPTTWIVNLRKGVQFPDGYGEMTASDVANTVNYIIQNNLPIAFLYAGIKKVDVVNKFTLKYELQYPDTAFVESALQGFGGMVMSWKAFQKMGAEKFSRDPIATGPFMVKTWVAGDHITLVKNPAYWDKSAVKLSNINIRFVPDPSVKENLLTTGSVNFIDSVAYQDITSLKSQPGIKVLSTPGWNWNYISFGTVNGPFGNKAVRQAISYAIDRSAIAKQVYYGYAVPAYSPLPKGFLYSDPSTNTLYGPNANVAKAKQLLAAAGYPKGFSTSIIVPDKADIRREATIIQQELQAVGINAKLDFLDNATYAERQRSIGNFIDLNQITIMSPDPDSAIYWFWYTGGSLAHNYSNQQIDHLIAQGRMLPDGPQRAAVYQQLQKAMIDQSWYIYIVNRDLVRAMSTSVHGYQDTPQDMAALWFKYTSVH